ncbi:hypothetical protein P7C70_g9612, partial [Phenoliferia sp. Uapishka_3]
MRRSTGMTPFAMLYGTEAVLPVDQNEETWIISDWKDKQYTRSELLEAQFRQLERKSDLIIKATEKLRASRLASVLYHDRVNAHRLREPLEPGVLVLVHNATLDTLHGGKFLPRWTGPYRVKERLKKGSYLLEELDDTPMKRVYAARRIRRYYPRGRKEEDIKQDELLTHDIDIADIDNNEEWNGNDEVPAEDIEEGDAIMTEVFSNENAKIEMNIKKERKPIFELPDDEESLGEGKIASETTNIDINRDNTDESDDREQDDTDKPRPIRKKLQPDWYVTGGWDAKAKAKAAQAQPLPQI